MRERSNKPSGVTTSGSSNDALHVAEGFDQPLARVEGLVGEQRGERRLERQQRELVVLLDPLGDGEEVDQREAAQLLDAFRMGARLVRARRDVRAAVVVLNGERAERAGGGHLP